MMLALSSPRRAVSSAHAVEPFSAFPFPLPGSEGAADLRAGPNLEDLADEGPEAAAKARAPSFPMQNRYRSAMQPPAATPRATEARKLEMRATLALQLRETVELDLLAVREHDLSMQFTHQLRGARELREARELEIYKSRMLCDTRDISARNDGGLVQPARLQHAPASHCVLSLPFPSLHAPTPAPFRILDSPRRAAVAAARRRLLLLCLQHGWRTRARALIEDSCLRRPLELRYRRRHPGCSAPPRERPPRWLLVGTHSDLVPRLDRRAPQQRPATARPVSSSRAGLSCHQREFSLTPPNSRSTSTWPTRPLCRRTALAAFLRPRHRHSSFLYGPGCDQPSDAPAPRLYHLRRALQPGLLAAAAPRRERSQKIDARRGVACASRSSVRSGRDLARSRRSRRRRWLRPRLPPWRPAQRAPPSH